MQNRKSYYQRHLPHIIPQGETFFVTFRLKNTVPLSVIEHLKNKYAQIENEICEKNIKEIEKKAYIYDNHKRYFADFDKFLDSNGQKIRHLENPAIAQIVADAIHFYDKKSYQLHSYCIMPNHVHLLITENIQAEILYKTTASIKRYSVVRANKILQQVGQPFWADESYDHLVRNEQEFENINAYILNNPVKAGLVEKWQDWKFSYCEVSRLL